ncbi:MAG: hypothetical protein BGP24_18675 [Lysobacterales bacterium 69-70]|nr:MAG: hypothetical protein ABS97_18890 [Xanthomonadaceae bacterium SCN 69-320]ODV16166.1 MAG: hypothetical protein ABT27_20665 [Xanthomonadaceae bacterium SCN 69-25]OJY98932.1 MAG: hypothetical protein BGP24_18675 [Xanthomonadales bacterium 69-70]
MRSPTLSPVFAAAAGVAAFVVLTGLLLPAQVAAHFDAGGRADAAMPRAGYLVFFLVFAVALPLFVAVVSERLLRNPRTPLNLPRRDYWLAPERRAATVDFLCRQNAAFAVQLMLFLGYVQALVVCANRLQPPQLPSTAFLLGLLLFVAAALWRFVQLVVHLRKAPPHR